MSAYVVFTRTKTIDQKELEKYRTGIKATMKDHPIEVLVADGKHEVLEGDPIEGMVIVKFPSVKAAKDWIYSELTKTGRSITGSLLRCQLTDKESMPNDAITPFILAVPQADLEDLNRCIDQTRCPDAETVDDWTGRPARQSQGADRSPASPLPTT